MPGCGSTNIPSGAGPCRRRRRSGAPQGLRLDVSAFSAIKAKAVYAHESQTTDLIHDDPTGFRLEPAMIDRLCGPSERFVAITE